MEAWLPTSPKTANSNVTPTTSPPASPPTVATVTPVEPDRYRLIVARACPWANRAIIVRRLLGPEPVLSIGFCGPTHDVRSWTFDLDPGGVDPSLKIPRLQDAYFARFPDYRKGITCRPSSTFPPARW
jgi:glutathionyl-hydroquinone reductase